MGAAYLAISTLLFLLNLEGGSMVFALFGLAAILVELVRNCRKNPKEKEALLDEILSKEHVFPKSIEKFLDWMVDILARFFQTRLGRCTGKSIVLIYELYELTKKYCPLIRLV
jgi:hypothetical protein